MKISFAETIVLLGDSSSRKLCGGALSRMEQISVRIPEVVRMTGPSRSKIYELIAAGDIEAAKVGRPPSFCRKHLRLSRRQWQVLAGARAESS